jgi:hyperosmotically inducible periplasmic protein
MIRGDKLTKGNSMKKSFAVTGLLASSLLGMQTFGAEREGPAKDAWIDGKLEGVYAVNRYLRAFAIGTEVEKGVVHLTGKVESDTDRDLAGEIAKGIDGVVDVDNDLLIATGARVTQKAGEDRSFGVWIDDATTTAAVKAKLLGNANIKGTKIDVDTRGDVVTLSGQVTSAEEKSLAEELAQNTGDVKKVTNRLVIARAN